MLKRKISWFQEDPLFTLPSSITTELSIENVEKVIGDTEPYSREWRVEALRLKVMNGVAFKIIQSLTYQAGIIFSRKQYLEGTPWN